ncbi:hypothetical protein OK18_03675 [Chryseobacterium gallinarum]|uniref:RHS repeat protein n=2 Tax=Chryseobacterium gallinarum TaxID=1324352 RepID=A0A0G3M499_CHRGL|nr:hypothetical protein OK18_03675 [Chryseobacterium gallinarum]
MQSYNTGITQPVPSVSSLATYAKTPVSFQTGVPDISYSLINVPTNHKLVNISLGLNYHIGNVSNVTGSGEMGMGWSVLGNGVITREILDDFDETFDNASANYYIKNEFNDIYNFNIPGESGKFKVERDIVNNTFHIVKLSPYTSKLEYTRTSNTATLIFDSFTITSDEGIKYHFRDYNISRMRVWLWDQPLEGSITDERNYRSAFYLTSISDEKNQELVKYNYLKDITYTGVGSQIIESETLKLNKIEIKDKGVVEINYSKNEFLDKKIDKFSIESIILKTIDNQFVKKYKFEYAYSVQNPARLLDAIGKVDVNENIIEKIKFDYYPILSDASGGTNTFLDVLKKVRQSTGGNTEYDFELVPSYYTQSLVTTIPRIDLGNVVFSGFDYNDKKYFFTISQNKEITVEFLEDNLSGYPWSVSIFKKEGSNYQLVHGMGPAFEIDPSYPKQQKRTFTSGEYYISLHCSDLMASLNSSVTFKAFYNDIDNPVQTVVLLPSDDKLLRVKKIQYFNENNSFPPNPSAMEEYSYNKFDDEANSSGYYINEGYTVDQKPVNPIVVYRNVKVSNGNGYTKYYFKTADAYPTQPTFDPDRAFWPNFNIMRSGLLEKKEIYSSLNQKLAEETFEYTLEEYNSPMYLSVPRWMGGNFYLRTSWVKNHKVNSKQYFTSGVIEASSEIIRNNINYKISTEKMISYDGSVLTTAYKYAHEKLNQKLINANMISIPLETTIIKKQNANDVSGKILSKTETKYDNPATLLPTSVLSYDIQNPSVTSAEVTYDQYDSKGNLLQYTTKDGISTVIIWGYNGTQPIAKIEGATYGQVQSLASAIITASDTDASAAPNNDETALLSALNTFRNSLSGYPVTTYTYDPLIGVRSITPPSGIRESYIYDSANRLEKVIDANGKVLKEMRYNYKN